MMRLRCVKTRPPCNKYPSSGHRIVTTRVEGMAASDTLDRQPAPLDGSVLADRLEAIMRAGRGEATRCRQHPGEGQLVQSDQSHQEILHAVSLNNLARRNTRPIASSTWWKDASRIGPRAIKTTSHPPIISRLQSLIRTDSRIRRLIRFRTAAFPIRRPTAKPKRLCSRSLGRIESTSRGWTRVWPPRRRRSNSALARRRYFLYIPSLARSGRATGQASIRTIRSGDGAPSAAWP